MFLEIMLRNKLLLGELKCYLQYMFLKLGYHWPLVAVTLVPPLLKHLFVTISQPLLQITDNTDRMTRGSSEKIVFACWLLRSVNELANELSGTTLFTLP